MIELNQVAKRYHAKNKDVLAVDHVDLNIESGSIFGMIGFSGTGKGTLIRIFSNLEEPTSGDIIIDGDNINKLSKSGLGKKRQEVSMIFQHFNSLWSCTVVSSIMFPLEVTGVACTGAEKRTLELVGLIGLEGRKEAYPPELSGGQKQGVGIARALVNGPDVLLCDEATSALDSQTAGEILDLLLKIKEERNLTIVIITHEMRVTRRICDAVAVMENGHAIEQDNVDEVFENPQHEVTKRPVKDDLDDDSEDSIKHLEPLNKDAYIIGLDFNGNNTTQPVVSDITRTQNIELSILEANIRNTHTGSIGFLIVYIPHISEDGFNTFVTESHKQHVNVEVIKHG